MEEKIQILKEEKAKLSDIINKQEFTAEESQSLQNEIVNNEHRKAKLVETKLDRCSFKMKLELKLDEAINQVIQ